MNWITQLLRRTTPAAPAAATPALNVEVSVMTDIGCQRKINQDCGRYLEPVDAQALAAKGLLVVVADGMGGHTAGEIASQLAVEVISREYYQSPEEPSVALPRAVHEANREIHRLAQRDRTLEGMGTTCVVLVIHGAQALAAHVGDSRLYLIRGDDIYLMTEDHSAVMDMVRRGLLTLDEARHHAGKNIILRALGIHPHVEVSVWQQPLPVRAGDCFLLCSDGLYDLVSDDEMKCHVLTGAPQHASEQLISLAKQRGGHDNITVGIASLRPAASAPPRPVPETREVKVEA